VTAGIGATATSGSAVDPSLSSESSRSSRNTFGIDRIAVTYPASAVVGRRSPPGKIHIGGATYPEPGGFAHISFCRGWVRVNFNPSRWFDPSGYSLVPIDVAVPLIQVALRSASSWVPSDVTWSQAHVTVLHLATDFRLVVDPPRLIEALAVIPRPYQGKVARWFGTEGLEGVHFGSQAHRVKLYDKSIETRGRVPFGTMRFEVQLGRDWLRRRGVLVLADLSAQTAGDLAMEAWEWSRMGAEVTNARSVLDQIEDMEVSDTVKAGLQRDLRLLADGISPSSWHRKKRLTDFINGFGVSADALAGLAPSNGSPISERLDLSTGQATTTIALSTMGSGT